MKHLTPLQAIRKHCLICAGRPKDVRFCDNTTGCYLFPFRMGHNPARKGIGPSRVYVRSILEGVLTNSTRFSEGNESKRCFAMSKDRSLNQVSENKGKRLIKMEAIGKVQMLDKKIIIEW